MTVTEQIFRGSMISSLLVVSLVFVFGFLRFVITSKRQGDAVRAASAYERERKALRTTLAFSLGYTSRLEDYVRVRLCDNRTKRILDSAPPTDRLVFAIDRKQWEEFERIASGRK